MIDVPWVALFFGALLAIYLLHKHWPRSPQAMFAHHYRQWLASCRRRGLSPSQVNDEMQFRHAMARLRRRASEATLAWPEGYREEIARIAGEEATTLALVDRSLAKRFLAVVETAPLADILYPEAMEATNRVWAGEMVHAARRQPTADDVAAVRSL